jgi:hypothetical protein
VRTAIIALFAAALVFAAPAVAAKGGSSKTPDVQHHVAKTHHAGGAHDTRRHAMQTRGSGYPGVFGYAPGAPAVSDQDFVRSRQFGGGGGGGGSM